MAEIGSTPQQRVRYLVEVVWNDHDYTQLDHILDGSYFLINSGKLADRDAVSRRLTDTRFTIKSMGQLKWRNDTWVGCEVIKQTASSGSNSTAKLVFVLDGATSRVKNVNELGAKRQLSYFQWSDYTAGSNIGELDSYLGILSEEAGVFSGKNAGSFARRRDELERFEKRLFGQPIPGETSTGSTALVGASPESLREIETSIAARAAGEERGSLEQYLRAHLPQWSITDSLVRAANELIDLRRAAPIAERVGVPSSMTTRIAEETTSAIEALGRSATKVAAVAAQNIESDRVTEALDREIAKLDKLVEAIFGAREALAELTLAGPDPTTLTQAELGFRKIGEAAMVILSRSRLKEAGYQAGSGPTMVRSPNERPSYVSSTEEADAP